MKRHTRFLAAIATALILGFAVHADAQRRAPGDKPATQGIHASLKVGNQTYDSKTPGKCTHAPIASIYQVMSQMWSVQQSSDGRSLSLTMWRPKDGSADMVNLSVDIGNASSQVGTVRGAGAQAQGTAKVTFEKTGAGGTFTLDARAKDGTAMTGPSSAMRSHRTSPRAACKLTGDEWQTTWSTTTAASPSRHSRSCGPGRWRRSRTCSATRPGIRARFAPSAAAIP